ncbi:MAG: VTT domain-containing protein [Leptospira sp.]|nr:VTT domain-containing protein [Leptospira sp.]
MLNHLNDQNPDPKELTKLFIQTFISIILVIGFVFGIAYFFREPLLTYSKVFVNEFGYLGLFFGMILSDSLPAFIPPDAFLMLSISGDLNSIYTITAMSIGSIIGGSIAYLIGRFLIPRFHLGRKFVLNYEDKFLPYVRRYGFFAVVIAALTPIPYSWMAYTVGTFKMPFRLFFLGSLFRIIRITIYYYAILIGWISGA